MRALLLSIGLLCGLAACSGNGAQTNGTGASPTGAAADCEATAGADAQGSAFGGTETASAIKLGPSSSITPEEAAKEAPAREGTPVILTGTVYTADCRTPAAEATINVWQTDARGIYGPGQRTDNLRCCYLQGTLRTDSEGRYRIETIKPGHYRGEENPPPGHIHLEVLHEGEGLLTEVFFAGDPSLPDEPEGEVITLRKETGADGKRLTGRFDIVLGG